MSKRILGFYGTFRRTKSFIARRKHLVCGSARHLAIEALEGRQMLATLIVNVFHDEVEQDGGPKINDGDLTLRDAIAYVNDYADPGPNDIASGGVVHIDLSEGNDWGENDTILFDSSIVDPIVLTAGQLEINRTVKIDARDLPDGITINANDSSRVFYIENNLADSSGNYDVTLTGLTIKNGQTSGDGGNIYYDAAVSGSTFSIIDTVVEFGDTTTGKGGGIYYYSMESECCFSIRDSKIENN